MPKDNHAASYRRYVVVLGALIIQLCLGSIYAWSIYQTALSSGAYNWPVLWTQLPFATGLACIASFMIFAGRWQDRVGPRKVATTGGIILGIGYLLAAQIDTVAAGHPLFGTLYLVLTYGVLGGGGIGVAYVCPIAALMKWFPDKKGTITGVAVATFGGGSFLIGYLETFLIILGANLVGTSFLLLGITYLLAVTLGSQLLSNPPEGWIPPGAVQQTVPELETGKNLGPGDMTRTRTFWLLWTMFLLAPTAGLMTLSNVKSVVQAIDVAAASDPITWPIIAALILGIMALFNGAGRLFWGYVSDRFHRIKTLIVMFVILAGTQFAFAALSLTNISWLIAIGIAAITGFCFGGNFTLFPSMTAEFFGTKNLGVNWGVLSTAYGIAGVTGALVAGNIVDYTGSYFGAFMITGVLSLFAVGFAILLYALTIRPRTSEDWAI